MSLWTTPPERMVAVTFVTGLIYFQQNLPRGAEIFLLRDIVPHGLTDGQVGQDSIVVFTLAPDDSVVFSKYQKTATLNIETVMRITAFSVIHVFQ